MREIRRLEAPELRRAPRVPSGDTRLSSQTARRRGRKIVVTLAKAAAIVPVLVLAIAALLTSGPRK